MENGRLSFKIDGKDLGVAFENEKLKNGEFYVTVNLCFLNEGVKIVRPPVNPGLESEAEGKKRWPWSSK